MKRYLLLLLIGLIFMVSCKKDDDPDPILRIGKVNKVYIDHNGTKWFVTGDGLISLNTGGKWNTYSFNVSNPELTDIDYQSSHYGDELWFANTGGAVVASYEVDAVTSATVYTKANSEIISDTVTALALDKDNARWFSTPWGISVFRGQNWYDTTTTKLRTFKINSIDGDTTGWMFFASEGAGVFRFKYELDGITGASVYENDWSAGILSDSVNVVFVDGMDQWYGTDKGASKHTCFLAKECWEIYTTAEGLISNNVKAITKDHSGRIWFGTDAGVTVLDGTSFTSYTTADGLVSNDINSIATDSDGSIWFATTAGISHLTSEGQWISFSGDITE